MAPRRPYGSPVDPAFLEAMRRYSAGDMYANPFVAPTDMYGSSMYSRLPPEDQDEIGTLDYAKDYFNAVQDENDIRMDPAWLVNQGASLGGYPESAYGYRPQYELLNMPGYVRAQQALQSGDPLNAWIAERAMQGHDPMTISTELETILLDPQTEEQEEFQQLFAGRIPGAINERTNQRQEGTIDYDALDSMIRSYTEPMMMNDPRWDGVTFDPVTNLPALVQEVPTEAQEALERAGYTNNPYETYDQELFATPQQLELEAQQESAYDPAVEAYRDAMERFATTQRLLQNQQQNAADMLARPARQQSEVEGTGSGGPSAYESFGDFMGRNVGDPIKNALPTGFGINRLGGDEEGGKIPIPWFQRRKKAEGYFNPESLRSSYVRTSLGQTSRAPSSGRQGPTLGRPLSQGVAPNRERESMLKRLLFQQGMARDQAKTAANNAAYDAMRANYAREQREQLSQKLAAQGFTPFNARRQAQMNSLWGF